jgi:thiamine biosynthesis lipoprotein
MGTVLELTLLAPDEARGRALAEQAFATAARLEALLTNWEASSALMRLNAAAGQGPREIDPELGRVLAASKEFARRTRGAFDITVGPLVELWRTAGQRDELPSAVSRARALAAVGSDGLRVDLDAGTAELVRPGARLELGGLAKGWALDRMAEALRAAGIRSALLSFGQSSVWAIGAPPGEAGWRLLVRTPAGGYAGIATLRDRALSVSSSLGQGIEIAGQHYGHVLDPRTGEPLRRAAQAVVLAPTAAWAEAQSKALLVLPPTEGIALLDAERDSVGLLLEADGYRHESRGWAETSRFEFATAAP